MRKKNILSLVVMLSLIVNSAQAAVKKDEKPTEESSRLALSVMGWVEDVIVQPSGLLFSAKLDTGAKTSSIDALNIERFQDLDGKEWVRFTIQNKDGDKQTIEKPVLKWVRIKQKGGGYIQRPVVNMGICLGSQYIEGKMNLAKRDNFIYQVLIGRNMLADHVLVDSGMRRTSKPACETNNE